MFANVSTGADKKVNTWGCGGGALQRGQAPALWEARSEGHDPGEVDHLHVSIAARRHADPHFTTLISHLGSNREGRALHHALLDVTRRTSQLVACETVGNESMRVSSNFMHACVHVQVGRVQDSPSVSAVSVDATANSGGRFERGRPTRVIAAWSCP